MLWRIFRKIDPVLLKVYNKLSQPPIPNNNGDRDIENTWIAANIPDGSGEALDFGCGPSWLGLLAARKGFKVTAIDLEPVPWYYKHPSLNFIQGDIFKLNFSPQQFDLIISCSSVEHVGLKGRYGVTESEEDGDIKAMRLFKSILKPDKTMLLTIPVGRDMVFYPLHRVYGPNRLPKLIEDWKVIKREYWIKDSNNHWNCVDESVALDKEPLEYCYGLGLFVLKNLDK